MMKVSRTLKALPKVTEERNGLRDRTKRTHSLNLKMMKESRMLNLKPKGTEVRNGSKAKENRTHLLIKNKTT